MRRHARLKGSANAICTFCANRLGPHGGVRNVTSIGSIQTHRRGFRTGPPNANQPSEAQGWDDIYSPDLSFQPSLHAITLAKETKQRLNREEERNAEHNRQQEKVRQDRERGDRIKTEASEASRVFRDHPSQAPKAANIHVGRNRKRGPTIRKLTLSFPPRHATESKAKDVEDRPLTPPAVSGGPAETGMNATDRLPAVENREEALLDLSRRISPEKMPSLDYRDYSPPRTAMPTETWTDHTWAIDDSSTSAPNAELQAQVNARLEEQNRLEDEKQQKRDPVRPRTQEQPRREDIERRMNQRLRWHGQLTEDQENGRSNTLPSARETSSTASLSPSLQQGVRSTSVGSNSPERIDESDNTGEPAVSSGPKLRQQLEANRKPLTPKSRGVAKNVVDDTPFANSAGKQPFDADVTSRWSIFDKSKDGSTKRSRYTPKSLNKNPADQKSDAFASSRGSPQTSDRNVREVKDALSDFAAAIEFGERSGKDAPKSRRGAAPSRTAPSFKYSDNRGPQAHNENNAVQIKPAETEEILFSGRSRKSSALEGLERSESQPYRRQQDMAASIDEDHNGRRRGNKRPQSKDVDDIQEDRRGSQRGRRRERDDEFDDLDDLSGLRKIRERRQKDRNEKKQRAQIQAQRKAALATKRSEALAKIVIPQFITVSRLAQALGVKLDRFTRKMESLGFSNTTHDHVLSAENASLIALEFNFDPTIGTELEVAERDLVPRPVPEDQSAFPVRPPIVTIMGHVDHGKTTILDYLRKSSVAASEHGGITQHIGAFSVRMSGGKLVTFLDTPGHAAFLSMRKRGANVTDIVILVVAADDSVKPQTLEALKHAREAKVPIIVAVNKVDKPEADVQRVKNDLARHGIEIEDFGGDVQVVPVSGKTGKGMDDLEEAVVTLGEILDHRADDAGAVEGWVLEATTKASGRVATVLVRNGTLKQGSIIVAGQTWTRVRSLQNEAGMSITSAGPGTPVEVDGWRDQPAAGDLVLEAETEQRATDVVDYRIELAQRVKLAEDVDAINEARRLEQEKRDREKAEAEARENDGASASKSVEKDPDAQSDRKEVAFIIKADVSGSAEAVESYLQQLVNPICSPRILRSAVGPVSEFDVEHASTAGGHIITFNLPAPANDIASLAEHNKVKIVEQNVIYRLLEQVKSILEDTLEPTMIQRVVGEAIVLKPFDIGIGGRKKLRIAGSRVQNGQIKRSSKVRVLRNGVKVYDGTVSSLKNLKKDVTEMRKGTECGVGFDEWTDAQEGDQIQTYEEITEKRTLPI